MSKLATNRSTPKLYWVVALASCLGTSTLPAVAESGQSTADGTRLATPHLTPRAPFSKSRREALAVGRDARTLVVKLVDDAGVLAQRGQLASSSVALPTGSKQPGSNPEKVESAIDAINAALSLVPGSRVEPLFGLPKPLLDAMRHTGERNTGAALADLSQFFVVHIGDASAGAVIVEELLAQPAVETAYAPLALQTPVDVPPMTYNFHNGVGPGQGYRDPGPAGIDIDEAWRRGLTGAGVTIADIELSWNLAHEDLDHLVSQSPPVAMMPSSTWSPAAGDIDHGTATLGVLASGNNGYGTTGLVPGAKIRVMPVNVVTNPSWNGANSVVMATVNLQPGDVLLVEAELARGFNINVPFEADPAEYAAVAQATALGIHVIEPAGNTTGGLDLDTNSLVIEPGTNRSLFDRYTRDSGAVLVGAGASAVTQGLHNPYPNSNFGSRVDTYAWGQNVTTLGFGPRTRGTLANCANSNDPFPQAPNQDQYYTYCYNGTSSAGAIVAGAAAVLEEKHRSAYGQPYGTRELRNLLSLGTGSVFGAVGHQPDLDYQLDFMDQGGVISHLFEHPPEPNQSRPDFGQAVAGGGDVNGDGRPDLIVGVPGFAVSTTAGLLADAGRVYVFSGATGDVLYRVDGTQTGGRLGAAVAIAGDADGDGFADFAIGVPRDDTMGLDAGKVDLYSGQTGTALGTFYGGAAGELYGSALAYAGNVNPLGSPPPADPFDDLVIGAPGANFGAGRAEVRNILGWTLQQVAGTSSDELGFAVAGTGDLDGDGLPDYVVGAPGAWGNVVTNNPVGAVYAYSVRVSTPIMTRFGHPTAGLISAQRFGAAVDGAGDFDGDGGNDVVVGAPEATFIPGGMFGRVDVVSRTGGLIASFDGGHPRDHLGRGVAGLGDFDGDGFDDIALGSPNQGGMLAGRPGRVRVVLGGRPNPPIWKERLFWTLDNATEWGSAVAFTGDVNGDGLADVVAGEPNGEDGGRAYVFSDGPAPNPFASQARLIAFVPALEAHDVDGNGFSGGGRSPSVTNFTLDAGPAWAGADYAVLGIPDVGNYLTSSRGTLDGQGMTSMPLFGPFQAGLLCQGIGFRFGFIGAALQDLDGDGIYDIFSLSNLAEVEVINEYAPLCR